MNKIFVAIAVTCTILSVPLVYLFGISKGLEESNKVYLRAACLDKDAFKRVLSQNIPADLEKRGITKDHYVSQSLSLCDDISYSCSEAGYIQLGMICVNNKFFDALQSQFDEVGLSY